jgi:hypothetical protein
MTPRKSGIVTCVTGKFMVDAESRQAYYFPVFRRAILSHFWNLYKRGQQTGCPLPSKARSSQYPTGCADEHQEDQRQEKMNKE